MRPKFMARKKKQPKRTWLRMFLIFLVVPLGVWFVAFLLWFNWYDLKNWLAPDPVPDGRTRAVRPSEKVDNREIAPGQPRERLFDDDRKKLEEILKRRS